MTRKRLSQIWTESGVWALHHESTDCLFHTPRSDFQVEAPGLTFSLRFGHLGIVGPKKVWGTLILHHYPIEPTTISYYRAPNMLCKPFPLPPLHGAATVTATPSPVPWGRLCPAKEAWGCCNDRPRNYSGLFARKMNPGAGFPKVCSAEQGEFMWKKGSESLKFGILQVKQS